VQFPPPPWSRPGLAFRMRSPPPPSRSTFALRTVHQFPFFFFLLLTAYTASRNRLCQGFDGGLAHRCLRRSPTRRLRIRRFLLPLFPSPAQRQPDHSRHYRAVSRRLPFVPLRIQGIFFLFPSFFSPKQQRGGAPLFSTCCASTPTNTDTHSPL